MCSLWARSLHAAPSTCLPTPAPARPLATCHMPPPSPPHAPTTFHHRNLTTYHLPRPPPHHLPTYRLPDYGSSCRYSCCCCIAAPGDIIYRTPPYLTRCYHTASYLTRGHWRTAPTSPAEHRRGSRTACVPFLPASVRIATCVNAAVATGEQRLRLTRLAGALCGHYAAPNTYTYCGTTLPPDCCDATTPHRPHALHLPCR